MLDQKEKKRSEFTTNILKLVSGALIAQAITLGLSPLLSRIFTPDDFGVFTFFSSIYALTALISGGRYENAILLPKKEHEAANVLLLSLLINIGFLFFFYLVLLILSCFLVSIQQNVWYFLLPVFSFVVGVSQCLIVWYNRKKKYNEMVYYRISNAFVNGGASVYFGFFKLPFNGLLTSFLLSNILSLALLLALLRRDLRFIRESFSWIEMKKLAKQHIRFPLFNSFQAVLDALQINGIVYLLAFFFGSFYVGLFSQAVRMLFMPMNLIGSSISQVFYQQATVLHHEQKSLKPLIQKTLKKSLLVFIPVCLTVLLFGPQLFALVFGEVWRESGVYAQILVCWFMLDFVRSPLSQIPIIFHMQHVMMVFSLCSNLLILSFILVGFYLNLGIKMTLLCITVSQSLYIVLLLLWIWKLIAKKETSLKIS